MGCPSCPKKLRSTTPPGGVGFSKAISLKVGKTVSLMVKPLSVSKPSLELR
jgi:hypothetical protein